MHHCQFCKSLLPDNAHFCAKCGHLLNTSTGEALTDISTFPPEISSLWHVSTGPLSSEEAPSGQNSAMPNNQEREDEESENTIRRPIAFRSFGSGPISFGETPRVEGMPSMQGNPPDWSSLAQGTAPATSLPFVPPHDQLWRAEVQAPDGPSPNTLPLFPQTGPQVSFPTLAPQVPETSPPEPHTEPHTQTKSWFRRKQDHQKDLPPQDEKQEDKRRRAGILPGIALLVRPPSSGSVPMVGGTPSVGGVPTVPGVPPTGGVPTPPSQGASIQGTASPGQYASTATPPASQATVIKPRPWQKLPVKRLPLKGPKPIKIPWRLLLGFPWPGGVIIILVPILIVGPILYAKSGGPNPISYIRDILGIGPASSATVTITPASADLKNAYSISEVTGTPNASKNQVAGARRLTATTSTYMQSVNATGQGAISGVPATGTITIMNDDTSNALLFNAGTVVTNQNPTNIQVTFDTSVIVPPASGSVDGSATVSVHVVQPGTIGNIASNDFGYVCGSGDPSCGQGYEMNNDNPFTGGQDPQTYTFVQQSDIGGATNILEQTQRPNAQQVLQGQVRANEQFIGSSQCTPNVTSDHAAGDHAASVTVSVSFTCTGEVYSQERAVSMATQLLTKRATTDPGTGYALMGKIKTGVTSITLLGGGTVKITVNTEGIWVYQFSTTQKQALAKLMTGKAQRDVQARLLKQMGVAKLVMQLSGGDQNIFPTDPSQIKILVQQVPGLPGTPTPIT